MTAFMEAAEESKRRGAAGDAAEGDGKGEGGGLVRLEHLGVK